jgi:hypothetical protein
VGRARASIDLPVQVSAAEGLWYDTSRWPVFVDGFGHVAKLEGDWPRTGARRLWNSGPAGRGRVVERVTAYEVRSGQTVEVEDERMTGTQRITFSSRPDGGCRVDVDLRYKLKQQHPLSPLVDLLFVRRAFNDALRRTLSRFGREVRADSELG